MGATTDFALVERRKGESAEDAYRRVADARAWESGRSYSGTFGSKYDGVSPFAVQGDPLDLRELMDLIENTGYRPLTVAEQAYAAAHGLSLAALGRAAELFEDKWGPAVALITDTHIAFGGTCSS